MKPLAPFTSLLFVPGNRPERFAKALASGAGVVAVDCEDAVAPDAKDAARAAVLAALAEHPGLAMRINGLRTRAGLDDLAALAAGPRPACLLVPMVESAAEIAIVRGMLGADCPPMVPLVETVAGLRAAPAIAASGVAAMMLGAGDLSAELGCAFAWEPLLVARAQFVMACAEARVPAIDVPFLGLDDAEGLAQETARARDMGFAAKAAIHPGQVATIDAVLRPTDTAIAEAEEALAAFAAAGGQAVRFRGRMLEAPFVKRLERIAAFRENCDA